MEDIKKNYENKIKDLCNELVVCLCKIDGKVEKVLLDDRESITEHTFICGKQELFSITNDILSYYIKVYDYNHYKKDYIELIVMKDNHPNVERVLQIMENKYEDQESYSDAITKINNMIYLLTSNIDVDD